MMWTIWNFSHHWWRWFIYELRVELNYVKKWRISMFHQRHMKMMSIQIKTLNRKCKFDQQSLCSCVVKKTFHSINQCAKHFRIIFLSKRCQTSCFHHFCSIRIVYVIHNYSTANDQFHFKNGKKNKINWTIQINCHDVWQFWFYERATWWTHWKFADNEIDNNRIAVSRSKIWGKIVKNEHVTIQCQFFVGYKSCQKIAIRCHWRKSIFILISLFFLVHRHVCDRYFVHK